MTLTTITLSDQGWTKGPMVHKPHEHAIEITIKEGVTAKAHIRTQQIIATLQYSLTTENDMGQSQVSIVLNTQDVCWVDISVKGYSLDLTTSSERKIVIIPTK